MTQPETPAISDLATALLPTEGYSALPWPVLQRHPRIVCLCGSTRFIEQFATLTWLLELRGYIVLGCTLLPPWYCGVRSHFAEATGTKEQRDAQHQQKIDRADEVLVLDFGGYIGESTCAEIAYATAIGKPVRYVSKDAPLVALACAGAPPL